MNPPMSHDYRRAALVEGIVGDNVQAYVDGPQYHDWVNALADGLLLMSDAMASVTPPGPSRNLVEP